VRGCLRASVGKFKRACQLGLCSMVPCVTPAPDFRGYGPGEDHCKPRINNLGSGAMNVGLGCATESINAGPGEHIIASRAFFHCKPQQLVNRRVLDYIVPRVGNSTPALMWELLASARMAARRGDARRALIDACTALIIPYSKPHFCTVGESMRQTVGATPGVAHRGFANPLMQAHSAWARS
jgi:hypothetical protein